MKQFLLIITCALLFSCSKEDKLPDNKFSFESVKGGINPITTKGFLSIIWKDNSNSNWKLFVKSTAGDIIKNETVDINETVITGLDLDVTYIISVKGEQDSTQSGTFNARIASQGDVEVGPF